MVMYDVMWGVVSTHLPAYDGYLPTGYLVYTLQLAFALIDQTGYVFHGLVGCLYIVVITEK